jgi:hypothetical protein
MQRTEVTPVLATIITAHRGRTQVLQVEAPVVKDCLITWAGQVGFEGVTDETRTRLRGQMADFDRPPIEGFGNVWRFESDLGTGGPPEASVVVVLTQRA